MRQNTIYRTATTAAPLARTPSPLALLALLSPWRCSVPALSQVLKGSTRRHLLMPVSRC